MNPTNCLLIDDDASALQELAKLLSRDPHAGRIFSAGGVAAALHLLREERIDILFIRIGDWDEYRRSVPLLTASPRIVVFLSGPAEKGAVTLEDEVDFHLQSPYRAGALSGVFNRLKDPLFVPRSLDFFFLKANRRYYAIAYSALRTVSSKGRSLTVRTDRAEYQIAGSLSRLQQRLPSLLCRVGPSLLIAGQGVLGGYPSGDIFPLFATY